MMRTFTLLNILLLVHPVLSAPAPKEAKQLASLDGTWEVTELHIDGVRSDSMSATRWMINGESLEIEMLGKLGFQPVVGFTYRLGQPKDGRVNEIDYILAPDDKEIPPSTFRGIFVLSGETLKICRTSSPEQDRPKECKPMPGTTVYVLKRVKAGIDK